jgi:tetratricopeptide (TPR) repeat protein
MTLRPLRGVALVLAAALLAGAAEAMPSRWDRLRDPGVARQQDALTLAVKARTPRGLFPGFELSLPFESLLALRAATVLEMAGGEALGGADVLFFLGDALVRADRGRDEEARRILRAAIAIEPDSERAASAWFDVAIASNRLREFDAERSAYDAALTLEWNARSRARIYLNRGEASMSLGELDRAVRDYERALATSSDSELHALATWGLAVALARRGELPRALEEAWTASRLRFPGPDGPLTTALELPGVFFTPPHEVSYYRALGEMAQALHAADPEAARTARDAALLHWSRSLDGARATGDRYLENALHQELWCQRRLARVRPAKRGSGRLVRPLSTRPGLQGPGPR